jgi:hypothetical protein
MICRQVRSKSFRPTRRDFLRFGGAAALGLTFTPALESLKSPVSGNLEKGVTVATVKSGATRWRTEWTMEKSMPDGRRTVRFTERGSGRYSPFNGEVRWNTESVWDAQATFRPLTTERAVMDAAGKPLLKERKTFNFDKGIVVVEREDKPSRRSIEIPADTISVDGIAGALRSLPFNRPFETHLLSNEPKLYDVSFETRGRERVQTPAGAFECYKVELVPGLGVLSLFRFVVPKAFFWFTVDPPHFWTRYEGPENGRGTPDVVMVLERYER